MQLQTFHLQYMISILLITQVSSFRIMQMLANTHFKDNGDVKTLNKKQANIWYKQHGVQRICNLPHNRFMNCSTFKECQQYSVIVDDKVKQTAEQVKAEGVCKIVMLDIQCYDSYRFKPQKNFMGTNRNIIDQLKSIAKIWKKFSDLPFGFYGQIPQITFNRQDTQKFDALMPKYKQLSQFVDFTASAHYNWNWNGDAKSNKAWLSAIAYNAGWAKKLAPKVPFMPLIKPTWEDDQNGGLAYALTYEQMYTRLQAIRQLGGQGVIFWDWSYQTYLNGDKQDYTADTNKGWFKAVMDFQKNQKKRHN